VPLDLSTLPDDAVELKSLLRDVVAAYGQLEKTVEVLQEELRLARAQRFGRKSEKWSAEETLQGRLFNEAEAGSSPQPLERKNLEVKGHRRGTPIRKPLPADLPRETVTVDILEEQKVCGCGAKLACIGEEVSEKLDIVPAKAKVLRTVRLKYACKKCQGVETEGGAVRIAPAPAQLLPKSIATPGLMAYLLSGKYCDGLPFYRQEKIFQRLGIEISRTSMCEWTIEVADMLKPLLRLMKMQLLSDNYIHADETTVRVVREPAKAGHGKAYMWVFRSGGTVEKPLVLFEYHPSRSGEVVREFLGAFQGRLQTDGYVGYAEAGRQPGITHLGCFAHIRREFHNVYKANAGGTAAEEALGYIKDLYAVEREADEKKMDWEQRAALRREKAKPVLDKFLEWLHTMREATPPKGLLGKAVAYALGQWERAVRYVEDGRLKPDNNAVENAIRPFVIGRNGWLFCMTPQGAHASASFYSLVETAKACGLEPYWYLRYVLTKVVDAHGDGDYAALLPNVVSKDALTSIA
jgi:transposase